VTDVPSTRQLDATQHDAPVLTMTASFTTDTAGYEYDLPRAPDIGAPKDYVAPGGRARGSRPTSARPGTSGRDAPVDAPALVPGAESAAGRSPPAAASPRLGRIGVPKGVAQCSASALTDLGVG
jgi:hypothetical protein